jgi:hypothetical protein
LQAQLKSSLAKLQCGGEQAGEFLLWAGRDAPDQGRVPNIRSTRETTKQLKWNPAFGGSKH